MEFEKIKRVVGANMRTFYEVVWDYGKRRFGITLPFKRDKKWLVTHRYEEPRMTATTIRCINPVHGWIRTATWKIWYFFHWIAKETHAWCQGCGQWHAEYRIRDPNYGKGNTWFTCCKKCVNFYDVRGSALKIVKWKHGKPICRKRW